MIHLIQRMGLAGVLGLWFAQAAWGLEGPRLIQTEQGSRWMSESEIAELMARSHEEGHCGGFMDVTDHMDRPSLEEMAQSLKLRSLWEAPVGSLDSGEADRQIRGLLPELSAGQLRSHVDRLSSFKNRYFQSEHGVAAIQWIRDQFLALSGGRTDIQVEFFTHPRWKQPSVIARIVGTGGNGGSGSGSRAAEKIILGAHADSINWSQGAPSPDLMAPGADDDASGVATLLEVFRVLAQSGYRPERTIEFMAYAGEERGLLGSQAIAESYRKAKAPVMGVMQFDMTMFPGKSKGITFIDDHVDPELTKLSQQLVDRYVGIPWKVSSCQYACSDHASWTSSGYRSVFPFEALFNEDNPSIHTPRDTLDQLDVEFGLAFAKLGLAFAIEMSL